ncbi:uncharacterized protein LOC116301670 [Actinia tenebrosa]|uniref:Uncharacterized protein LOC116301670 n=1 Tax=Actinia tenebrosa TaxID=6105 RepID=A0A6P8IIW0_ACTTE|nr:uncharacterized protein LOC116301670 [Actinia tenebrosa]
MKIQLVSRHSQKQFHPSYHPRNLLHPSHHPRNLIHPSDHQGDLLHPSGHPGDLSLTRKIFHCFTSSLTFFFTFLLETSNLTNILILLGVRAAVIETLKPVHEIAKLMIEDHKEMMRRVKEAVDMDNIFQAKHVVGEYFIALNRRFLSFFIHAEQSGLFEKIDDDKDDKDMKEVRRELQKAVEDGGEKGKEVAEFILKNFNQFRVSDGLPDRPFVALGVETAIVLAKTFKQMEKVTKISMKVYIDMISDIVRLALKEHNHQGAVQRAGAGVLSMIRRQTKVGITLHHMYSQKQCRAGGPEPEKGHGGKGKDEEKEEKDD